MYKYGIIDTPPLQKGFYSVYGSGSIQNLSHWLGPPLASLASRLAWALYQRLTLTRTRIREAEAYHISGFFCHTADKKKLSRLKLCP